MMADDWTVQEQLLLSNILESMPNQNLTTVSKIMRQSPLLQTSVEDTSSFLPKKCGARQDSLLKQYEPLIMKLLQGDETVADLKLKPTTYGPISHQLRKRRIAELKKSIRKKESEMRMIRQEIVEIRNGNRDKELILARQDSIVEADEMEEQMQLIDNDMNNRPPPDTAENNPQYKKKLLSLYKKVLNHKWSDSFRKPVTEEEAPGYHKIIKNPIDLGTIGKKLENGEIVTKYQLLKDIFLMCQNAIIFNPPKSDLHTVAHAIRDYSIEEAESIFASDAPSPDSRPSRVRARTGR